MEFETPPQKPGEHDPAGEESHQSDSLEQWTPSIVRNLEEPNQCEAPSSVLKSRLSDIILGHSTQLYEQELQSIRTTSKMVCVGEEKRNSLLPTADEFLFENDKQQPPPAPLPKRTSKILQNPREICFEVRNLHSEKHYFREITKFAKQTELQVATRRDNVLGLRSRPASSFSRLLMGCIVSKEALVVEFKYSLPTSSILVRLVEGSHQQFQKVASKFRDYLFANQFLDAQYGFELSLLVAQEKQLLSVFRARALSERQPFQLLRDAQQLSVLLSAKYQLVEYPNSWSYEEVELQVFQQTGIWGVYLRHGQAADREWEARRAKILSLQSLQSCRELLNSQQQLLRGFRLQDLQQRLSSINAEIGPRGKLETLASYYSGVEKAVNKYAGEAALESAKACIFPALVFELLAWPPTNLLSNLQLLSDYIQLCDADEDSCRLSLLQVNRQAYSAGSRLRAALLGAMRLEKCASPMMFMVFNTDGQRTYLTAVPLFAVPNDAQLNAPLTRLDGERDMIMPLLIQLEHQFQNNAAKQNAGQWLTPDQTLEDSAEDTLAPCPSWIGFVPKAGPATISRRTRSKDSSQSALAEDTSASSPASYIGNTFELAQMMISDQVPALTTVVSFLRKHSSLPNNVVFGLGPCLFCIFYRKLSIADISISQPTHRSQIVR